MFHSFTFPAVSILLWIGLLGENARNSEGVIPMAVDDSDKTKNAESSDGSRKKGARVGLLTVVLLVVEAAAIGGGFMMFSSPVETEAVGMSHAMEAPVHEVTLEEVVIFDGSLGNEVTGVALRYPTRIFLKVDARDRLWIEADASRSAGTIHAQLSEIWKLAARRELESPDLAAMEARIKRSFDQENLFDRRPSVMPSAGHDSAAGDGHGSGSESGGLVAIDPDRAIVHDVIVVMGIGRRVHR